MPYTTYAEPNVELRKTVSDSHLVNSVHLLYILWRIQLISSISTIREFLNFSREFLSFVVYTYAYLSDFCSTTLNQTKYFQGLVFFRSKYNVFYFTSFGSKQISFLVALTRQSTRPAWIWTILVGLTVFQHSTFEARYHHLLWFIASQLLPYQHQWTHWLLRASFSADLFVDLLSILSMSVVSGREFERFHWIIERVNMDFLESSMHSQ